jgi:hypothetical protein
MFERDINSNAEFPGIHEIDLVDSRNEIDNLHIFTIQQFLPGIIVKNL